MVVDIVVADPLVFIIGRLLSFLLAVFCSTMFFDLCNEVSHVKGKGKLRCREMISQKL